MGNIKLCKEILSLCSFKLFSCSKLLFLSDCLLSIHKLIHNLLGSGYCNEVIRRNCIFLCKLLDGFCKGVVLLTTKFVLIGKFLWNLQSIGEHIFIVPDDFSFLHKVRITFLIKSRRDTLIRIFFVSSTLIYIGKPAIIVSAIGVKRTTKSKIVWIIKVTHQSIKIILLIDSLSCSIILLPQKSHSVSSLPFQILCSAFSNKPFS